MFRQLLSESLLLAGVGGAAGLLVTLFGLELLTKLLPGELPRLKAIELDGGVLTAAVVVTMATGIVFGVVPAWRGGQFNVAATLKLGGTAVTGGPRRAWFTRALIIGQIALVLVLLSGAGLMVRSVSKLLTVDVGFDPRGVVMFYPSVDLNVLNQLRREAAAAHITAIYNDLQQRLAALPGVEAVGYAQEQLGTLKATTAPRGTVTEVAEYRVGIEAADPLRALRARLTEGRWLTPGDGEKGHERVLLNESAARRLWPGESPVGKRLWLKAGAGEESVEIAGVIGDLRQYAYNEEPKPTIYRPERMQAVGGGQLVVRTAVHYSALRSAFEREIKAAGAAHGQPTIYFIEEVLYSGTAGHRTFMRYLLFFAGIGLLLAAIGLYGVLAYSVTRRTREIGIRVAVGAQRCDIIGLILRQGLALVIVGAVAGVAGSLAATRALKALLFGVPPHDPATLIAVTTVMAAVALTACWLPARRAAKIDPVEALRSE